MADQEPSSGGTPEAQPPADEGQSRGPSRPPPSSGQPPMSVTRSRLGTGPGPAASRPAGGPPAQPAADQPVAAAEATPSTPPEPAAPAASRAQTQREGAEQQVAAEMGEQVVEADEALTAPIPPSAPAPAAARPAPPRPAAPGAAAAPPARPAGATGAPARAVAAVPARPIAAGAGAAARPATPARPAAGATAERLAAAVTREPPAGGGEQAERLVYVWPHLVTIEFVASLLMLLSMIILSWIVNGPLEARANPDHTPNPSKAPWYFLNLQELLLHMHPALAGVLVPAGALTLIAMIPYIDRDSSDVGKWFGTASAAPIAILVTIYTIVVEVALVFFDAIIGVKPLMTAIADATGIAYLKETEPLGMALFSMPNVIVPSVLMLGPIVPLMFIIWKRFRPNRREVMVALFTGFVVSYVVLTIFGTFFRGQGMQLYWPWDPHMVRID